jgi:hypothetical protein
MSLDTDEVSTFTRMNRMYVPYGVIRYKVLASIRTDYFVYVAFVGKPGKDARWRR